MNHVTTNPFFVPTQFGFQDAATLLGLPTPKWAGSATSLASEMVSDINTAIAAKATASRRRYRQRTTFTSPVAAAMNAGIPVVSYNADGPIVTGVADTGTNRLRYVGQALYLSGQQMGERIKSLAGPGEIVIFIATPGRANIQPRYDGAARCSAAATRCTRWRPGRRRARTAGREGVLHRNKNITGAFAVDAGSTEVLGQALAATGRQDPERRVRHHPEHAEHIQSGLTDFTIDQDPYLQGFLPTLYLYLYNLSGGTISPPDTDTGLTFVTKSNAQPYTISSRFQGSTTAQKYIPRPSGAISNPIATTST